MTIESFAPVLIPTLNRYEHFKRCVESLSRCTYADKTELVIGLDFPPSEKYVAGWEKVCEFIPFITGFGKVTIFKRDFNYGPKNNIRDLKRYARQHYDRFITAEDDNEFSPNFLEYMNKALIKYEDYPQVLAICGYNYPVDMGEYNKNIYASHEFCAWGVARWVKKERYFNSEDIYSLFHSPISVVKLMRKRPGIIMNLVDMLNKKAVWGDTCFVAFSYINDYYTISPSISLLRNHGHDGTGAHCGKTDLYEQQRIDNQPHFELDEIEIKQPNIKGLKDYFGISFYNYLRMFKWLFCFYVNQMSAKKKNEEK